MHKSVVGSQASPAAGADVSFTVDTEASFRLLTLRAKLVTAAAVANRFPHFQVTDQSGDVIHELVAVAAQAAGATVTYQLSSGNGAPYQGGAISDGVAGLAWPDLWFPAGSKIVTTTTAVQAADQWSGIFWSALIGDEFEHVRWLERIATGLASMGS